jgi:Tfp pilus assembly protein PilN
MIQINLLGLPKPKKGKRAAASSTPGEGPNPMVLIALAVVVSAAAVGGWWYKLKSDGDKIATQMSEAQKEASRLAVAKAKYDEREAQRKIFEQRVHVIEDLRRQQQGPIELLAMIGDTVNNTEGVWLGTLKEDGRNVNIEGTALSVHQVASLMKNLQTSGYFRTVEMKETAQDEQAKDMQVFNFTLICEKLDKSAPPTAQGAAAAPAAPKKM